MQFSVEHDVFAKLPDVCFGIVMARNIKSKNKGTSELLQRSVEEIKLQYKDKNIKELETIRNFRESFVKLNINPSKYLSSIEAILSRIVKSGTFPNINNIVDLCNHVSLQYLIPIGAHDIDKCTQDLMIRFSEEGDTFLPFGSTTPEAVDKGELVYVSGNTVKTRRWIWRQSDEGKITNESQNVFIPIDGFYSIKDSVVKARDMLASLFDQYFICELHTGFVDTNKRMMIL